MKATPRVFLAFLPLILCVFLGVSVAKPVSAAEVRTRDTTISEDEYIDDDLFLYGTEIQIDGTITGDVIASGDSIVVSGNIDGNAYLFGGQITVTGEIGKSLHVACGRLKFSGVAERNAYIAGGQIMITSDSYLMEDLLIAGGQLDVDGWVGDDLWVAGGNIDIQSQVQDDLYANGGAVQAKRENVKGDYKVNESEEGTDWGWSRNKTVNEAQKEASKSVLAGLFTRILWISGMFLVGLVLIRLMPVKTLDVVEKIRASSGEFVWSMVIGILVMSSLPVAVLLLGITVIGAPLALLVIALMIFFVMFGILWGDMAIGSRLAHVFGYKGNSLAVGLLVGMALRAILMLIPCVGFLYSLVLVWAVIGASVRMKYDRVQESYGSDQSMSERVHLPQDDTPEHRVQRKRKK